MSTQERGRRRFRNDASLPKRRRHSRRRFERFRRWLHECRRLHHLRYAPASRADLRWRASIEIRSTSPASYAWRSQYYCSNEAWRRQILMSFTTEIRCRAMICWHYDLCEASHDFGVDDSRTLLSETWQAARVICATAIKRPACCLKHVRVAAH